MNCDIQCYDVTNTSVNVQNNYCMELVGGEFVTTTVKCLQNCLSACVLQDGLTQVKSPHGGNGKFSKVRIG